MKTEMTVARGGVSDDATLYGRRPGGRTAFTRRGALVGVGAAVVAATVAAPAVAQAADPEEAQVLAVFRQLDDGQRAVVQMFMRCLARLPADPMINARVDWHLKPVREARS